MNPVLEVRELSRSFGGIKAVDGISFNVAAGQLIAMIGPNGAGKSTCFNLINGQLRWDRGTVKILGRETDGMKPRDICRLGVGRTFQITATYPSMTVRENVQMALVSHHRRTNSLFRRMAPMHSGEALRLLEKVGMDDQHDKACGVLAYGDLKRVELAVALAGQPQLLLMDEPTAGMAPGERVALMKLTANIVREQNIGVLFTEHDMDVVFANADRIMVLNRGKLVAEGLPETVREDALVKEIYLGSQGTA